jgi:hypothetical protein
MDVSLYFLMTQTGAKTGSKDAKSRGTKPGLLKKAQKAVVKKVGVTL